MAKSSGLSQEFFVGGYDVSGDTASIERAGALKNLLEITGINKSAKERISGLASGELSFNTYFNPAADAVFDAVLGALPTADVLVMWATGTTLGDPVANLNAKQVTTSLNRSADGSLISSIQALSNSYPLEWGILLAPATIHSSADDETGFIESGGAQTSKGGVGWLHHNDAATGTVHYDIEDSPDSTNGIDGAWTILLSFSNVATPYAQIAERVEITGTVEKYVRASTNETFTNADFAMSFRRGIAQDDVDLS